LVFPVLVQELELPAQPVHIQELVLELLVVPQLVGYILEQLELAHLQQLILLLVLVLA
jgi:hypothetical protein